MTEIYIPQILKTPSPIPYLFEKLIPYLSIKYHITTFKNVKYAIYKPQQNVREIYAGRPQSVIRLITRIATSFQHYDIIHTSGAIRTNPLMIKLAQLRNKNIKHIHTFRVDEENPPRKICSFLGKHADITTAVSKHTAKTLEDSIGISPYVIYNGVDLDYFKPGSTYYFFKTFKKPYFVFIGRMVNFKNPHVLIKLAKEIKAAQFILIGDGPELNKLKYKSKNVCNVHFLGKIEKKYIPGILANSNGLIFPTFKEGCPNVILEAMSCAVPIVSYSASSIPELIKHEINGYLANKNDFSGLLFYTKKLLNRKHKITMGIAGRSYVEKLHDFAYISKQYLEIYSKLTNLDGTVKTPSRLF